MRSTEWRPRHAAWRFQRHGGAAIGELSVSLMKSRRLIATLVGTLVLAVYTVGYCSARAHLRLVHRCFAGEDAGNKLFLTSKGGHRVGRPIYGQGVEQPPTFEYFLYAPLRFAEGTFWRLHYTDGERLPHADPRRYR